MDIKFSKKTTVDASTGKVRLQIWISETSDNIPAEIFLYRAVPDIAGVDEQNYLFYGVCSYADLINYPAITAGYDSNFYRTAKIDMLFESISNMGAFIGELETGIQALIDDIAGTHSATPDIDTLAGTNFSVQLSSRTGGSSCSTLIDITATLPVFVMTADRDGTPDFVSLASLADMVKYGTDSSAVFYRTDTISLAFSTATLTSQFIIALTADVTQLDADLTSPGLPTNATAIVTVSSGDITDPTTFYFGDV